MDNNIIDFYNKEKNIDYFLSKLRYAKFTGISIKDGEPEFVEYVDTKILGFLYNNCFITLDKKFKAYKVNTDINSPFYFADFDEIGLYVSKLYNYKFFEEEGSNKHRDIIIKEYDLAMKIRKWYLDHINKDNPIPYSDDDSFIERIESDFDEYMAPDPIDFKSAKRTIDRIKLKERILNKRKK